MYPSAGMNAAAAAAVAAARHPVSFTLSLSVSYYDCVILMVQGFVCFGQKGRMMNDIWLLLICFIDDMCHKINNII